MMYTEEAGRIDQDNVRKIAMQLNTKLSAYHDSLFEGTQQVEGVKDYFKGRSLFDMAMKDITFDLAAENPAILNLKVKEYVLPLVKNKLSSYALDENVRYKYAGMMRS